MFSTLTSHPNNGNLLYLLDFLEKWVPVGLWNFFASKVNEKRWLRVSPPLTAPWLALSVCVRVSLCTHVHALACCGSGGGAGDAALGGRATLWRTAVDGMLSPESPWKLPWLKPVDLLTPPFPVWCSLWSEGR